MRFRDDPLYPITMSYGDKFMKNEKLVRDQIPYLEALDGKNVTFRTEKEENKQRQFLIDKLREEVGELAVVFNDPDCHSGADFQEEAADILQVIVDMAVLYGKGVNWPNCLEKRESKCRKLGGFDQFIIMEMEE